MIQCIRYTLYINTHKIYIYIYIYLFIYVYISVCVYMYHYFSKKWARMDQFDLMYKVLIIYVRFI
ncbi:MAG: hypothetical protein N7Q72_03500, partial [Spiroplasma sp. Tabriz.8]|nr:hypothetical protein [Spiroplasma sp. Tabriz.8]